jgi:hypothetical protein
MLMLVDDCNPDRPTFKAIFHPRGKYLGCAVVSDGNKVVVPMFIMDGGLVELEGEALEGKE